MVAAVYSPETRRQAETLRTLPGTAPDLLELRLDCFAEDPAALDELAASATNPPRPLVVTVRRADEGGASPSLDDRQRRLLYRRFLAVEDVACVDVEVRSLGALAEVVGAAEEREVQVIGSFHDFQGTPTVGRLRELVELAMRAGANVFKVATTTETPGELARLLEFLEVEKRLPLAAMGMGRLGKVSRVVLAAAGSVLNYGYLGEQAQVPGQWPAAMLRERVAEVRVEG